MRKSDRLRAGDVITQFVNGELTLTQAREILDYLENEEARLSPADAGLEQARGLRPLGADE